MDIKSFEGPGGLAGLKYGSSVSQSVGQSVSQSVSQGDQTLSVQSVDLGAFRLTRQLQLQGGIHPNFNFHGQLYRHW